MSDINKISVMSSFIKDKIDEHGWSMKKFIEETGLSQSYAYKLVSDKRDFTPNDETLNKIADVMGFSEKDRSYILGLAVREREAGSIIYSDEPVPEPPEPGPVPEPPEPVPHPEPQPPSPHPPEPNPPAPPVPVPSGDTVPWTHRKVVLGIIVGLLGGLLLGCCSSSVLIPIVCQYLNVQNYYHYFNRF